MITSRNATLLSDVHYDFRSFGSTADLLAVASGRITGVFNSFGATEPVPVDIWKTDKSSACQSSW